ncbi:DJ-1/PfpI family protein [Chitinophaga sp. Ak27]|uniref:DJ-1/PfpI family protein n=1 Tax=Chitinophaga sp. Ak27 TaxID=2726116 RepID=UPI00145E451B|nr:DJ-1/PfpI family protein [Chitinophaga sp. Ak27]NLU95949.1 hypothetical protein [Chitinophaga sp. Ak27]
MHLITKAGLALAAVACLAVTFHGCKPLKAFYTFPEYRGGHHFHYAAPAYDPARKTIFIVADNRGTELFDMMAPFYLFQATGKANVFVVAPEKKPVILRKGLYVLPHLSFPETALLPQKPDVLVVPALSAMDRQGQDSTIVRWIQQQYTDSMLLLSVCQGSLTMAATGLYHDKPITTHASELRQNQQQFPELAWVRDTGVTGAGNCYSTAGVSNAVAGSLVVIKRLFGTVILQQVMQDIGYPYNDVSLRHQSLEVNGAAKWRIGRKIFLGANQHVGVWLADGINELQLAAIMDTYYRTFPASIRSFSAGNRPVVSRFGLTLIPTGNTREDRLDELHVPGLQVAAVDECRQRNPHLQIIPYDTTGRRYTIDVCLDRIRQQYGASFARVVERMLDYQP